MASTRAVVGTLDNSASTPRIDGHRQFAQRARRVGLRATVWLSRVLADALAIAAAFASAFWIHQLLLRFGIAYLQPSVSRNSHNYAELAALFCVIALVVFWERGLYRPRASVLNLWELKTSLESVAVAAAIFFAMLFALRLGGFSRLVVTSAIALSMLSVLLERRSLAGVLGRLQVKGRLGRRVLIYGCDPTGQLLMKKLVQAPHVSCTVVGFLDDIAMLGSMVCCRIAQTGRLRFEAEVLGRWSDIETVVSTYRVEEILVMGSSATSERMREIFEFCRDRGLTVGIVPHVEDFRADQLALDDLGAIPVLRPQTRLARRPLLAAKRLVDVVGSLLLMLVSAPIWLVAMILVRETSPGPLLFVQERVGIGGRRFRMLKFRTMARDANPYAASPAGDVDARVTSVGRILRATGVDELPQLLNVLRGEMSLVGPRPEMPFIVDGYSALQRKRLEVRPGLTGLWQLSADRHAEIHENIEYDLYYIAHQSLVLDALILLETAFFTAEQVLKVFRRQAKEDARPADVTGQIVRSAEPYVLLALDQRRGSTTSPESWRSLVPAMYQIADRYRIKMLVARDNVQIYDALAADAVRRFGSSRHQPELIVYDTRAELRSLVRGATAVITDLPHVARWSAEVGCGTLIVRDGMLGQRYADLALDPLEEAIRAILTVRDPLAGTPAPSRDRSPSIHPSDVSWSSLDTPPQARSSGQ
ncbi:MAG TPA: sugar transferase [Gemmatimonadaceae bacterium]|nr:sugar transferase [Gemmatimonadaceae bacterium]